MPSAASAFKASGVDGFDGIGDGEQPGELSVDRDIDDGGAVAPQTLAFLVERLRFDAERCQEIRVTQEHGLAVDLAGRALAGRRVELFDLAQIEIALFGGAHDRVGERMLAGALDAGGQPQDFGFLESGRRDDRDDLRLAFGQRTGLVDHQRVDLLHALQGFRVLDQNAGLRTASDADHDRHRGGEPKRAGTGDDQHAHGCDQAERHPRFRPEGGPGAEGDQRHDDHDRHEPAGDLIGQTLDRCARALRLRDHLDDLRKQRVAPDLVGAHHETAGLVERASDHLAAGLLGDRHGFAGHQRFVERGAAFEDDAVDRHLSPGRTRNLSPTARLSIWTS